MTYIDIQSRDGQSFKAYVEKPDTPGPVVIMIQEIFGVNKEMRDKCREMAKQGYTAICPDLFWRIEPGIELMDDKQEELERAFELFEAFDVESGIKDLISTVEYARSTEGRANEIGCVGYCLGGMLSYRLACEANLTAGVSYYGVNLNEMTDMAKNHDGQLLLHIAENDEFVPKDAQDEIKSALSGKDTISIHVYEGCDHAFARENGMHYNAKAAALANQRTRDFLAKHLKA